MYRRRKKDKLLPLLIIISIISLGCIGYAYLNETLRINGETTVAKNSWSVKFTTITPVKSEGTVTTAPTVTGDTTLSFGVKLEIGNEYSFKVKIENQGTIDAMLSSAPTITGLENTSSYLEYSITYSDGVAIEAKNLLKAGSSDEILVRLKFKDDVTESDIASLSSADISKTLILSMTYVQDDGTGVEREYKKTWTIPTGRTVDTLQVGDEICTSTECFNFIRYDGNNIVMLSKYNLKVGNIVDGSSWSVTGQISKTAEGYGLQSSDARGYVDGASTFNGTVAFSATNYWSSLGLTYPADVYDNTYKTEPDFTGDGYKTTGYSIAYYVEEYKKKLEEMGATIERARLLTYSEATDSSIGCDGTSNYSCPTGFITNTSFWLGSACSGSGLWVVDSGGVFNGSYFGSDLDVGARPVIVISKSEV